MNHRLSASIVVSLVALALGVPSPASAALPDAAGIHVVSQQALDARLLSVRVATAAVAAPLDLRVLLPGDYVSDPQRRYPVLYLLHGTSGRAADWTTLGDAERTTAGLPVIVVMPDIGISGDGGGWCTNWRGTGPHGRPD